MVVPGSGWADMNGSSWFQVRWADVLAISRKVRINDCGFKPPVWELSCCIYVSVADWWKSHVISCLLNSTALLSFVTLTTSSACNLISMAHLFFTCLVLWLLFLNFPLWELFSLFLLQIQVLSTLSFVLFVLHIRFLVMHLSPWCDSLLPVYNAQISASHRDLFVL